MLLERLEEHLEIKSTINGYVDLKGLSTSAFSYWTYWSSLSMAWLWHQLHGSVTPGLSGTAATVQISVVSSGMNILSNI